MPLAAWMATYPHGQRLLAQPASDDGDFDDTPPARCCALLSRRLPPDGHVGPTFQWDTPAEQIAPDGTGWCVEHFLRSWGYYGCGERRDATCREPPWGPDEEWQYWQTPYGWCEECTKVWDGTDEDAGACPPCHGRYHWLGRLVEWYGRRRRGIAGTATPPR